MANNWITKKHYQQGGSLNRNPSNNGSNKGPLRKIKHLVYQGAGGMFGRDMYHLECGHEVMGTKGATRVRCRKCKQIAAPGMALEERSEA